MHSLVIRSIRIRVFVRVDPRRSLDMQMQSTTRPQQIGSAAAAQGRGCRSAPVPPVPLWWYIRAAQFV